MDLGPSPVSWTVVPRFNRVGSYIPKNSTVTLLGGLLTLDLFNIVIEKLPLSLHDYFGVRQRNIDLQANGSPGVKANPEDVSKEDARAGSSKFGFGFSSMRGEKVDRRRAAQDLRVQMKDLQFRLRELGTTGGSDSDESIFAEPLGVQQRKTKAFYEKSPIKPEKFPRKDFNRRELWVKHYKSVAKANGWTDQQAIAALPACLTSWTVEEFDTVLRKYIEKVPVEEATIFETLLEILKPKMQQYRSPRATRSEFKSVRQNEKESSKEYSRGVRYLGDLALCGKPFDEKDKDLRDQFLEGLFDSGLQQNLYEDKTNRNFCKVLQRAQELELIQKNARDVDQRRDKTTRADRVQFSYDDWEQDNVVKASFPNSHGQVEEKFAALQMSMGTVANRLDMLDATVARQGYATQQLMKSMNDNLSQLTAVMTQMPAVMTTVMAASMPDLKTVLVGVAWWSSHQQFRAVTTDTTATIATTKHEDPFCSQQDIRSREFK